MDRDRSSGRAKRANLRVGFLVRIFLLSCVAVVGSVWALVRFYTRERPPMVVPVVETGDASTREIEVEVK